MKWIDCLGYAASATVLATFCMNTMIPLRVTASLSNVLFASFGLWAHIYPVMLLHLILFPVTPCASYRFAVLCKGRCKGLISRLRVFCLSCLIEDFVPVKRSSERESWLIDYSISIAVKLKSWRLEKRSPLVAC